jgi:anti-sigma factor RsiW
MNDHDRHQDEIGAYLLSALEPAEQAAFEQHLAGCPECRSEVDRLRVAADALPRSVEPFEAPPALKRSLMEAVREDAARNAAAPVRKPLRERLGLDRLLGSMRPELAWVSAAFVLAVGIALGVAVSELSSGDSPASHRSVAAVVDRSRVPDASATLTVPTGDRGPAQLRVSGLPAPKQGQVYEIWLKRGDQAQPGPLFNVDSRGNGVGAIPEDLEGVTAVLVTRERTGGAQRPSEAPIISARI